MTTRRLPMFPLGTVLFPYAFLPLHVFEPRYRVLTRQVIERDHEFGVVLIERGSEVGGGDTRFDTGTIARVAQAAELPDGRYALACVGTRRVRVDAWLPDDPYPQADVVVLDEPDPAPGDAETRDRVVLALETVALLARRTDPRVGALPEIARDPVRASYEVAALAPIGPLDAQRVLETTGCGDRLVLLAELLEDRATQLRVQFDLGEPDR